MVRDTSELESRSKGDIHNCNEHMYYVPDSLSPVRYVRVCVHLMDDSLGTQNFSLEEGRGFVKALINNANMRLIENHRMNLPEGNQTPALNPRYQYKIVAATDDPEDDGFYRHFDNQLYYFVNKGKYRNNYSRKVIDKYAINPDSIINIFIMPHHPDSIASESYKAHRTGIALGTSLKIAGVVEERNAPWMSATLLNHEVGHILGLSHSWMRYDRCDDTPEHDNCWGQTEEPPCNGTVSNNLMDYNASQMAITPCQLAIIHKGFNKENHKNRKLCEVNWCRLDNSKTIYIRDTTHWYGARDIIHNIEIMNGGELNIYCRLSMPENGMITVHPEASLVLHDAELHNDCALEWQGIRLLSRKEKQASLVSMGTSRILNTVAGTPEE